MHLCVCRAEVPKFSFVISSSGCCQICITGSRSVCALRKELPELLKQQTEGPVKGFLEKKKHQTAKQGTNKPLPQHALSSIQFRQCIHVPLSCLASHINFYFLEPAGRFPFREQVSALL